MLIDFEVVGSNLCGRFFPETGHVGSYLQHEFFVSVSAPDLIEGPDRRISAKNNIFRY